MRIILLLTALSLGACAKKKPAAPPPEPAAVANPNPYHDVRPAKVKADVEAIQKAEEERNDKRIEQMKGE